MNCERYWIRFLPDILNGMKKGAFDLNALYFQAAHILTSNFLINMDDSRFENWDSQNRIRNQKYTKLHTGKLPEPDQSE